MECKYFLLEKVIILICFNSIIRSVNKNVC